MTLLISGLVIFFAIHLVPAMTGLKHSLTVRLGANGYRGLFSAVSIIGFALIVWGYANAEWVTVYDPPNWGRQVTMGLVFVAFICLAAFGLKGHIRRTLRHPMLIAVVLWGIGHLLANGDLASVALFGSFIVYGVVDMLIASAQGRVAEFEPKPVHDVVALIVGTGVYVAALFLHPYIIGVAVV